MCHGNVKGVDLDQIAGGADLVVWGLADGMRPTLGPPPPTTEPRRLMELAGEPQTAQDAAHHGRTELMPLSSQEDLELAFAHIRILLPQGPDSHDLGGGPGGRLDLPGTMGAIRQATQPGTLIALLPAVEGGTRDAEMAAGAADGLAMVLMPLEHAEPGFGRRGEGRFLLWPVNPGPGRRLLDGQPSAHLDILFAG
jgi:hypothetical protein